MQPDGFDRLDVRRALALVLIFAVAYLFSTGGHAYSVDEITNYASARFLVEYGSPDLRIDDPFPGTQLLKVGHPELERVTGRYGLLAWLPLSPLYALASATGPPPEPPSSTFPQVSHVLPLVVLLYNPVVAAVLVALVYMLARQIGLRGRYALCAAVIAGIGSPLWVYAKTLSSIPLASALTVAAFLLLGRAQRRGLWTVAASGVAAGLAAAVRPDYGTVAVVLVPTVMVLARPDVRRRILAALIWIVSWAVVVVPGVGCFNLYRSGSMLEFGYSDQTFLWHTAKSYIGVFGVLASPSFGLLVFMPVAAIGFWGLVSGGGNRAMRYSMVALTVMAVLGYGTFNDWEGGVSWGPRYLTGVSPLVAVGVGALLQTRSFGIPGWLTVAALSGWGIAVSALGVLVDFERGWRNLWDVGAKVEQIVWDPHFSLIGAHLRLLGQWRDDLIGLDLYLPHQMGIWAVPVLAGTLVAMVAVWAAIEIRIAFGLSLLAHVFRRTYNL